MSHGEPSVYFGLDVGKSEYHATALDQNGKRIYNKPTPQDETKLIELFNYLSSYGRVFTLVDQPASIGALAVAVARENNLDVAYLPGLAMRRSADLHPGKSKTDAKDAYTIAEAARTMPHALRRVETSDEAPTDLEMIVGYDEDLRGEATRVKNRIRGLLLTVHPALERTLGPHLDAIGVLDLLATHGGPTGLGKTRVSTLTKTMLKSSPRLAKMLPGKVK